MADKGKALLLAAATLVAAWLATGCAATPSPPPLTPVKVQLRWTHQAQFAGFYAADQLGYSDDEGLAVTFVEGGPNIEPIGATLDGQAQFGIGGADELILARADGKPVKAIATIYRRNPAVFMALASSGITRPQDLIGKTIMVTPTIATTFHAMMNQVGITSDQYTEVSLSNDVARFAEGDVVWGAFITGFALTVQKAGYKVNLIYPDDYGVHFYADTVFTTDQIIASNPDLVTRFLRATLKGWTYAVENPTAIGPMVLKYNPKGDAALENDKMATSLPLVNTGEDYVGWMKPEIWAGMEQILRKQDMLTKPLTITDVYTMDFLKAIYSNNP